jgi:hypothetical protein
MKMIIHRLVCLRRILMQHTQVPPCCILRIKEHMLVL